MPFSANEMVPVSSETTNTKASVSSLMPSAARCLVPKSWARYEFLDKGK
ncbi:MAG: hypothetical protein Q8M06_03330 [Methanobacteriaceae archaeon]|nr:hypothetical protein [Methanobacteriaceae archaeon]